MGVSCCVNPHLITVEVLTLKHCAVETHGSQKWDPPPHLLRKNFYSRRGDSIFRNSFLLRVDLSPEIVAILECTKRTESGIQTFLQITAPQNQEDILDPHELKVLLLGTLGKQDSEGQYNLKNLPELEETPEALDGQGV